MLTSSRPRLARAAFGLAAAAAVTLAGCSAASTGGTGATSADSGPNGIVTGRGSGAPLSTGVGSPVASTPVAAE